MSLNTSNTQKSGDSPKVDEVTPKEKVMSWLDAAKAGAGVDSTTSDQKDHTSVDGSGSGSSSGKVSEDEGSETNTGNNGSWNNGDRPFKGAMESYLNLMRPKLKGCIGCLHARPDFTYADVKVDPNAELTVTLDDGSERKYKFHSVHYGPLKNKEKRHWRSRDNIYDRMGVYPPFRVLQVEMLNSGYYLMDISDPSKSKRMIVRLFRDKPKFPLKLWHGYGVIPTLGAVTPQIVDGQVFVPPTSLPFDPRFVGFMPSGPPPGVPPSAMGFHPMFRGVPVFPPGMAPPGVPAHVAFPPQAAVPFPPSVPATDGNGNDDLVQPKLVRQEALQGHSSLETMRSVMEAEGNTILHGSGGGADTVKDDSVSDEVSDNEDK